MVELKSRNREHINKLSAAWRAENPGKVKTSKAAWRAANIDKVKAYQIEWRKKNPDKIKANHVDGERSVILIRKKYIPKTAALIKITMVENYHQI